MQIAPTSRVPLTLALALIALFMGWNVEGSSCVQKILPPAEIIPELEYYAGSWGKYVFTPNELTMAVVAPGFIFPGGNNYQGGVWIYRRANTSTEFELLQTVGNGTILQTVQTAFGADDYIVVGGRLNVGITTSNYTVLMYDADTGLYVFDQILDPGIGFAAASTEDTAQGSMCSEWIFANFRGASTNVIMSFYRNPDTTVWVKHGTVSTPLLNFGSNMLIGVSPACARLVTKEVSSSALFKVYKFSVADSNWILTQNWDTPALGSMAVKSMSVGETRFYAGVPLANYNMTADNQATNPLNLSYVEAAGIVTEYLWNGTHFLLNQEQMFQKNPGPGARCGQSVSLNGNTLAVGCPMFNTSFSFSAQCDEYPTICNKTTCAVDEGSWAAVNPFLFIRGRVDQYSLNADSDEFDFSTSREEICNSSLPWLCGAGTAYVTYSFGTAVSTINDEVMVSAPVDWTVGQVYVYGATTECERCPCKTDPPCENGGVCHDSSVVPFFFCECPANYTGVHCGEPRSQSASQPSVWTVYGPVVAIGGVAVVAVVVLLAVFGSAAGSTGGAGGAAASLVGKKGGRSHRGG